MNQIKILRGFGAGLFFLSTVFIGSGRAQAESPDRTPEGMITVLEDAGWCWYQDPRAMIHHGMLLTGGVSGVSGDVKVSVYDLQAGRDLGTVILHAGFQSDDHDTPAFYARPDGSVLAMYAKHGNEKLHYYRISDPEDYTQWGEEQVFDHGRFDPNTGVTYMNLYFLQDENQLYNFFRDGRTFNPFFITSSDHGLTWGNRTHFIEDEVEGRQRPYPRYAQKDANTVSVSFTEAHPRNFGTSIYYAEYRNGSFFRASGEKIKDLKKDGPLHPSEADLIYRGGGETGRGSSLSALNSAWTCAIAVDSDRRPHIGYTLYQDNKDNRFRMAFWNGEKWIDRQVAYAGKCLYDRESSYTGLMALDPTDPTKVFLSTDVDPATGEDRGGVHEIYQASVGPDDQTSTITWQPLTSGSSERNIRPILVAGDGYKVLLWLRGPWSTYTSYRTNAVGVILQRP
jgi:hypothetical protein